MRIFWIRHIAYLVLAFCGICLLRGMSIKTVTTVKQDSSVTGTSWEAKRVLFGTGLLAPEDMRTICYNRTLSSSSKYPLIQKNPLYNIEPTFYMSEKYNMLVCSVPKAGSTFWTVAMATITQAIKDNTTEKTLPRKTIHSTLDNQLKVNYQEVRGKFHGYKIVTARNPFSRLFSAYIDKIFLPTNWILSMDIKDKIYGKFGFDQPERICLNDLSFSDFLQYVTKHYNAYSNAHWLPITTLCEPCGNNTILIVHEENFTEDVKKVLNQLNISKTIQKSLMPLLDTNSVTQTISLVETLLYKSFLAKKHFCLSTMDILKRIWTSIQLQGRISESLPFPEKKFNVNSSLHVLKAKFKIALGHAVMSSNLAQDKVTKQRNNALINVYRSIHPGLIEKIRKIYYTDFAIFDYNMHVPSGKTSLINFFLSDKTEH